MKFLLSNHHYNPGPNLSNSSIDQLSLQTAKLYQSIFAQAPWDEVGIDQDGNTLGIYQVQDGFEPMYPVARIANQVRQVLTDPNFLSVISLTHQQYNINSEIRKRCNPQTNEFPSVIGQTGLWKSGLFVNGFMWASKRSTLQILQAKADFEQLEAQQLIQDLNLGYDCMYIDEFGVAPVFQGQQIGTHINSELQKLLTATNLTLLTNTSIDSGAFKVFKSSGYRVLAGPPVQNEPGLVCFIKHS